MIITYNRISKCDLYFLICRQDFSKIVYDFIDYFKKIEKRGNLTDYRVNSLGYCKLCEKILWNNNDVTLCVLIHSYLG